MSDSDLAWVSVGLPWISTLMVLTVHMIMYPNNKITTRNSVPIIERFMLAWLTLGCVLAMVYSTWRTNEESGLFWGLMFTMVVLCILTSLFLAFIGPSDPADRCKLELNYRTVHCLITLGTGIFVLISRLTLPVDGNSRSASEAGWFVIKEAWYRAYDSTAANTKPLCLFLMLSPFVFWYKYHDSFHRLRGENKLKGRNDPIGEFPPVLKDMQRSENIVSLLITIISVFIFFTNLDTVGISTAAVATCLGYFAQSIGWALQNLLGSVFSGFSLVFNGNLSANQLLEMDGTKSIILDISLTHTRCALLSDTEGDQWEPGIMYIPNGNFEKSVYITRDPKKS